MRTIAYDVIGVNVFLLTLMRFLLKKVETVVHPILLTVDEQQVHQQPRSQSISPFSLPLSVSTLFLSVLLALYRWRKKESYGLNGAESHTYI